MTTGELRPSVPARADVAILGASLAGLVLAELLAAEGVAVVVLEAASEVGSGWSGRHHGVAGLGLADHPIRLVRSLGESVARALVQWTAESLELADERELLSAQGVVTAALGDVEADEVGLSIALLKKWGRQIAPLDAQEVCARLGTDRFGPGWVDPKAGAVDAARALAQVAAAAESRGAVICRGARVQLTRDGRADNEVVGEQHGASFLMKADVVVHCAGAAAAVLDPFFGDKVYPVRFQMQRLQSRAAARISLPPLSSQLAYLQGAPRADGTYVWGGCRWATPHLEVGEADDSKLTDAVDARLTSTRESLLGLVDVDVVDRWAGIMTFTCDGLPIVGPLPGRVQHIACLGFNGRPWSHAFRAAQAVRDGLMEGRSAGMPEILSPQRFV